MSTELAIYDRINDPLAAAKQFGLAIHQSGMFGTAAPQQGEVLAMECMARRMPPLMLAERYHIIFGKLSMKYDAMLAGFIRNGGKYRVIEREPNAVEIELTKTDGETRRFRFTWEQAQEEPFIYEGKEKEVLKLLFGDRKKLEVKAKYQTPRARMQMLWARVVSDGVHVMDPTVAHGVYTPEEIEDFDESDDDSAPKRTRNGKPKQDVASDVAADASVIDVPFEDTSSAASASETKTANDESAPGSGGCSADQQKRIKELWGLLDATTEQRDKQLRSRHCSVVKNLTTVQADELLGKLEAVYAKKQGEAGPASVELVEAVKAKLIEHKQVDPGIIAMLEKKMHPAGYKKLAELSQADAQSLLDALTGNTMQAFLGVSLWPSPKPKESSVSKN